MHKFCYRGRCGSWLTLIALAFQLAVSFGHVHLDGVRIDSGAAVVGQPSHTAQSLPAQPPGDKDDYCAICASLYLAANSFVPSPPLLPVPLLLSSAIVHIDYGAAIFIAPRRPAFQSRAPPLV
jgi:predicted Kef-type K+ transport protein